MLKQKILAIGVAAMVVASPAYAISGSGQSVPTIDDNSGAIKSNTENIKQYINDIRAFLGADDRSRITGNGLEIDFGNVKSDSKNLAQGQWTTGDTANFNNAVSTYYGSAVTSSLCNQPPGIGASQLEKDMYQSCNNARNLIALNLYEIHQTISVLEQRNDKLQELIKNWSYNTSGDVQKKQYQIALMQTLIQNDMARLQTSLAAYQTKINLFKQLQAEAEKEILYGKQQSSSALESLLTGGGGLVSAGVTMTVLEKSDSLVSNIIGKIGSGLDSVKKQIRKLFS